MHCKAYFFMLLWGLLVCTAASVAALGASVGRQVFQQVWLCTNVCFAVLLGCYCKAKVCYLRVPNLHLRLSTVGKHRNSYGGVQQHMASVKSVDLVSCSASGKVDWLFLAELPCMVQALHNLVWLRLAYLLLFLFQQFLEDNEEPTLCCCAMQAMCGIILSLV